MIQLLETFTKFLPFAFFWAKVASKMSDKDMSTTAKRDRYLYILSALVGQRVEATRADAKRRRFSKNIDC